MKNVVCLLFVSALLLMNMHTISYAGGDEGASIDLIRLVSMGYAPGVEKRLEIGECDVNYVNDEGDTALTAAARRNDIEIMKILFAHGANPDVGMGREHLMIYAKNYKNEEMMLLINSSHQPVCKH